MVRPKRCRHIQFSPDALYFKPKGIPLRKLEQVDISIDELEALRLKFIEGKNNNQGAKEMDISSSTFQRIIVSACKKITESLVLGKAIEIHRKIDFRYPPDQELQ